ncbi:MAG: Ig-like domain repeat protein [Polyangiaceae bacterium]|nr:Ig-like domain repeat protein [Polyangiaceae bacterium]
MRRPPWFLAASFLTMATVLLASNVARSVPVRVTGTATVEPIAVLREGVLEASGRVTDDRGIALVGARVRVSVRDRGGRPRILASLAPCQDSPTPRRRGDGVELVAGAAGSFCLRAGPAAASDRIELQYAGDDDHDPSGVVAVPIVAGLRSLRLGFSPEPRRIELDAGDPQVWVLAEAVPARPRLEQVDLEVLLAPRDEAPQPLATVRAVVGERTAISLPVRDLGAPGRDELMVRLAGSPDFAPATRRVIVEKIARVELALTEPPRTSDPRQGLPFRLGVTSRRGPVPGGAVEVLAGGQSVGVAPVNDGVSSPVVVFDAPPGSAVTLTARFLPDSPWWTAGAPISIPMSIPRVPPWRGWPWMVTGGAIALWVFRAWRRPVRRAAPRPPEIAKLPPGKATIEVISRGPSRAGWHGRVLDAHLGTPVAEAQLALVSPSFTGIRVLARDTTDATGLFHLDAVPEVPEGSRLRVEAEWHSALERPVPGPSQLVVNLVTRRRALLDRLVAWAERLGRPWSWGAEPTPGHVARLARERGAKEIDTWARAVEAAAFGREPVDAEHEGAVIGREPPREPREYGSR